MRKRALPTFLAIAALWAAAAPAAAAPQVDHGFGADGVVEGRFGDAYQPLAFRSLGVQDDGSVVPSREPDKLDPEGKIDAVVPFKVEVVERLPSGGAFVGGPLLFHSAESGSTLNMGVEVARLDSGGRLDPSFGSDGIVHLEARAKRLVGLFPRDGGGVGAVTLDEEASYYGQAAVHPESTILELDAQGNSDQAFGTSGAVTTPRTIEAFHLLEGGSLAVAGEQWVGTVPGLDTRKGDVFVARYTPTGALDSGFGGGDGIETLDLGDVDIVGDAVWEGDGAVTVGGAFTRWSSADCVRFLDRCPETPYAARFTAAGLLDPTFGVGGTVRLEGLSYPFGRFEGGLGVLAVAPRPGGGVYAAGGSGTVAFVAALTAGGGFDPGYGNGGILTETDPTDSQSAAGAMAVDSQGRLLIAGGTDAGLLHYRSAATLFRYLPNGALDAGYGDGGGFIRLPAGGSGIALGADDSAFVLGGGTVSKVLSSGRRDPSFGKEGTALLPSVVDIRWRGRRESMYVDTRSIAALPHGRVLVAGTASKIESRAVLFRLRADGSLDPSFGRGGKVILGFGRSQLCKVEQMALQRDGRIVLAGRVEGRPSHHPGKALAVMRLRRDGAMDPSFGRGGLVVRRLGHRSYASAVALQGRDLLVAGRSRSGSRVREVLLRLRPDGRLDRGFARRGVAATRIPLTPSGYSNRTRQILLAQRRILVLRDNDEWPLLSYSSAGRARRAFRVARGAEPEHRATRAPFGAFQGGRLVLGWQVFSTPARYFKLQRLRIGDAS